jgi:hypothetical protein
MKFELTVQDDCAWLGECEAGVFDASPYGGLSLEGRHYEGLQIHGLRGAVQLGATSPPPSYRDCEFSGSTISRLSLGHGNYLGCRFQGARIKDLRVASARVESCVFSGRIQHGVVTIEPRHSLREDGTPTAWAQNDLSACAVDDVSFRGGIRLSAAMFATADAGRLIANARLRLRLLLSRGADGDVLKLAEKILVWAEDYQQDDYFIARSLALGWGADFGNLLKGLVPTDGPVT